MPRLEFVEPNFGERIMYIAFVNQVISPITE